MIIETRGGVVPHNPDHRDWITNERGRMRELQDLPCGGFPESAQVHETLILETRGGHHKDIPFLINAFKAVLYTQTELRRKYPRVITDDALFKLRIQYILGEFKDDEEYSERIESHDRVSEMKREIAHILEMFVMSGLDVMQRFTASGVDKDPISVVVQNLIALHHIVNESLLSCSEMWGRKAPMLTNNWKWRLPYARNVI